MRVSGSDGGNKLNTSLKQFLDKHIQEDTDTNKISVFPLPCGSGKSEYIKYAIADALINKYGIIIVTDLIERLNGYISEHHNDETENLINYIRRNSQSISILTADNIKIEISTVNYKPIVMMTTQRYFNLTRDEIIDLISKHQIKREKIIFDEKIFLLDGRRLTIKSLNNIATALNEGLDNTVNPKEKQWLIEKYNTFNSELQKKLTENEELNNDTNNFRREVYFDSTILSMSDDTHKFKKLIFKYKSQLQKYNPEFLKDIAAIEKLLIDGVVTSQKIKSKTSNQEYKNYFTVVTNNIDKLINVGAKVFVLDGTADISPEYSLKCINMIDCTPFKRDLSKLTINIVNINTSKDKLINNGNKSDKTINAIIDYIKVQPCDINTIFTYQAIEDKFKNVFNNVGHFGNIKGSNEYRNINNICQVGLNRWSEIIYMLYANEIGRCNDSDDSAIRRIYDKETIDNIRCRLILADIEQNLFRCKIRNDNNNENCTYTLICSAFEKSNLYENYQPLVDMIKSRYEPLGATINVYDTPTEFKILKADERKAENKTSMQKFNEWFKLQPKGRLFKRLDLKNEIKLTDSQFKEVKRTGILNHLKTQKQGIYQIK